MSERLDELERLNALHQRGTLSDDEYARAKANILGDASPKRRNPPWVAPAGAAMGIALAVFVVKPLVRGTSSLDPAGNQSIAASADSPAADIWTVSAATDPMTDAQITTAATKLAGRAADIELTVTCSSQGQIKYVLASYDKSGEPVPMRNEVNHKLEPYVRYQFRIDDAPPVSLTHSAPEYNNVIAMETPSPAALEVFAGMGNTETYFDAMAKAKRVAFALPLASSDETIVVDQTPPSFVSAVKPCIDIRTAQIAKYQQQYEQAERQRATGTARNRATASGGSL